VNIFVRAYTFMVFFRCCEFCADRFFSFRHSCAYCWREWVSSFLTAHQHIIGHFSAITADCWRWTTGCIVMRRQFNTQHGHWPQSMRSRVYETVRRPSARLSVPAWAHGSKPAARGDIDRLLQLRWANAGSGTLIVGVHSSWTQTCFIRIEMPCGGVDSMAQGTTY